MDGAWRVAATKDSKRSFSVFGGVDGRSGRSDDWVCVWVKPTSFVPRQDPPASLKLMVDTLHTPARETREDLARLIERHEGTQTVDATVARSGGLWWRAPRG